MIYFVWVNADDTTFDPAFAREDEDVFDLKITHAENQFPVASVLIRNPRVGLLAAGRKQYVWIASDSLDTGGVEPLFFGRLAGQPTAIADSVVQIVFRSRPRDIQEQKEAIAATLRVRPYWDALWIKPERRLDPETVLESRTLLWHYDRLSPTVTVSDIINGEDGTEVFGTDAHFDGSISVSHSEQPLRNIKVIADVYWSQKATGELDITQNIIDAFHAGGSTKDGHISTFTGQGLWEDWPEQEDTIGAGWYVKAATLTRSDGVIFPSERVKTSCRYHREPEPVATESSEGGGGAAGGLRQNVWGDEGIGWTRSYGYYVCLPMTAEETQGSGLMNPDQPVLLYFNLWQIKPYMVLGFDVERSRRETIQFTLSGDVQPIYTDAEDEETEIMSLSSSEVGEPIDEEGTDNVTPIYDARRRQYFTTDRGQQSIEYLIAIARARLLSRSRAISITFDVSFERAALLNCRKNATVVNAALPGGSATGKVIQYSFGIDENGTRGGSVTIACCVGRGNTVSGLDGEPEYHEDAYNDDEYAEIIGERIEIMDGAIWYERPTDPPNDDGVDFANIDDASMVLSCSLMQGGESAQRVVLDQSYRIVAEAIEALNEEYTRISLNMKPLSGLSFEQVYFLQVSNLMIPKTIDLETA